jgi:hypothetical protein
MSLFDRSIARFGSDEDNVLASEVLMPSQYFAARATTPYHHLLLAILDDAIRCFQNNLDAKTIRRRRLFRETEYWLFETKDAGFMSCPTVCESLGISAVALRRYLREWQKATRDGAGGAFGTAFASVHRSRLCDARESRSQRMRTGRKFRRLRALTTGFSLLSVSSDDNAAIS